MEQDIILKKKGVQMVRNRLKELLVPLGFSPHPRFKGRLVRVRDEFIDEVSLDTAGYHLNPIFAVFYRPAPFAALLCDDGRLWRTAKENITTHLSWHCEIPSEGGQFYYKPDHFEEVWRDTAYVLEHYILPEMEKMTVQKYLSLLVEPSPYEYDLFRSSDMIRFHSSCFGGTHEAAVYGVGMWRAGCYDEGVPYLTFAQYKYRNWIDNQIVGHGQKAEHFYQYHISILKLLDELISLWAKAEDDWTLAAQERIRQVTEEWMDYMP